MKPTPCTYCEKDILKKAPRTMHVTKQGFILLCEKHWKYGEPSYSDEEPTTVNQEWEEEK